MLQFPCRHWLCLNSSLLISLNVDLPWLRDWIILLLFCFGARISLGTQCPMRHLLTSFLTALTLCLSDLQPILSCKAPTQLIFPVHIAFAHSTGSMWFAYTKEVLFPQKFQMKMQWLTTCGLANTFLSITVADIKYKMYRKIDLFANIFKP